MADAPEQLSTSKLAQQLGLPSAQLFATLQEHGWIRRYQDSWVLTPKGEFEGGQYRDSKRFGRYIVWPLSLMKHQLLSSIESNQRISAADMVRYYPSLHARHINRALAELGLQQHSILGWELTPLGKRFGGRQAESEHSGAFYVTWPHEIADDPVVHRELSFQSDQMVPAEAELVPEAEEEPDLFNTAASAARECRGVDGHELDSLLAMSVCNWLYFAQLPHAFKRALPCEEALVADFYLPAGNVYVDCWDAKEPAERLSAKLRKRGVYKELGLRSIEVNADDADRLDEVLGRGLLAFGIRC